MKVAVPLPRTPTGKIYRFSPNADALPRHFLLGDAPAEFEPSTESRQLMKLLPRSQQTVCPYSGIVASDDDFTHPHDRKAAERAVHDAFAKDVEDELRAIARRVNGRQRPGSMMSLKMSVKTPRRRITRNYRQDLLRELQCPHCKREYGVYAISLFCPDCGAPNISAHFGREVELVDQQVLLAETQSAEASELAYRLLGNAHEDVVTAFEATLKTVYLHCKSLISPTEKSGVSNDFQNVSRAERRYAELAYEPFSCLDETERSELLLNIQKRHVIGHNLSIVDDRFAEHQAQAKVGSTVTIVSADIRRFRRIAESVVENLDRWLAAFERQQAGT